MHTSFAIGVMVACRANRANRSMGLCGDVACFPLYIYTIEKYAKHLSFPRPRLSFLALRPVR